MATGNSIISNLLYIISNSTLIMLKKTPGGV